MVGGYYRTAQRIAATLLVAIGLTFSNSAPGYSGYDDALAALNGTGTEDGRRNFREAERLLRLCAWKDDDIVCQIALGNLYIFGEFPGGIKRRIPGDFSKSDEIEAFVWYFLAAINSNVQAYSQAGFQEFADLQAEALLACNYVSGSDFLSLDQNLEYKTRALRNIIYILNSRGAVGKRVAGELHMKEPRLGGIVTFGSPSDPFSDSNDSDDSGFFSDGPGGPPPGPNGRFVKNFAMSVAMSAINAQRALGELLQTMERINTIPRRFERESDPRENRQARINDHLRSLDASLTNAINDLSDVIEYKDTFNKPRMIDELKKIQKDLWLLHSGNEKEARSSLHELSQALSSASGKIGAAMTKLGEIRLGEPMDELVDMYERGEGCPNPFAESTSLANAYFTIAKGLGDVRLGKLQDQADSSGLRTLEDFKKKSRERRASEYPDPAVHSFDYLYPPSRSIDESFRYVDVSGRISELSSQLSRLNSPKYNLKFETNRALDLVGPYMTVYGVSFNKSDKYQEKVRAFQLFMLSPVTGTLTEWEKVQLLKLAARTGDDLHFSVTLGRMYYHGLGVRKNKEIAWQLFKQGADRNHEKSVCLMYRLLQDDRVLPQDNAEALEYERKYKENYGKDIRSCGDKL